MNLATSTWDIFTETNSLLSKWKKQGKELEFRNPSGKAYRK